MVEGHAEVDILSAGQEVAFLLYERRISGVANTPRYGTVWTQYHYMYWVDITY
jgi:hypothetical protein